MLNIGEATFMNFLENDEKFGLCDMFEKKKYRVADSGMTYRQVHTLSKDQLTDEKNREEGSWRKFSFAELVYLTIVKEVRKFGLQNHQLIGLREAFLRDSKPIKDSISKPGYGVIPIALVFGHVQIILTIDYNGRVIFYTNTTYELFPEGLLAHIRVDLNRLINDLLKRMGSKITLNYKSLLEIEAEIASERVGITPREKQLLDILRNEEYKSVEVRKSDNKSWTVYGERGHDGGGKTTLDVLQAIKQKDFQDITIQTRGGKVMHYATKDVLKL